MEIILRLSEKWKKNDDKEFW